MRYIMYGKNIEVTEGLKSAIYDKLGKLDKYFRNDEIKANRRRARKVATAFYLTCFIIGLIIGFCIGLFSDEALTEPETFETDGMTITLIQEFVQKSKKIVKSKSALGMLIVLPLAASMQYINRWITEKTSGVKGAPIYDDFTKKDQDEQKQQIREKSKEGLLKQKIISISSMIGVGLLSMMKRPSWNMFEFKGQFPTMDQARIISTTTFASRMAAADDKNELAEATTRDIATFLSLYFLGDYAAKATASIIENRTGVRLLNDTKPIAKAANLNILLAKYNVTITNVTIAILIDLIRSLL